jgi:hypothetical protein
MADISRFREQAKKKRSAFADFLAGDQGSDDDDTLINLLYSSLVSSNGTQKR